MADAYAQAGVRTTADAPEFARLTDLIRQTFAYRKGSGTPLLDLGYYANVLQFGDLGIAVTMDGVGTKVIVALQAGDLSGIGIDLVAMNVNDLLCVGADPVALLDYLAVESLEANAIPALAASLVEGARRAGISIPGGEVAQVKELLATHVPGENFDIVGTALGVVPVDRIMIGAAITPGDVLLGLRSSGIHSNGFTLARRVLLRDGWTLETVPAELGRSLGAELLEATLIYTDLFRAIWGANIPLHGAFHMTGEGLLNLLRVPHPVSLQITDWPAIPPIFQLIRDRGMIDPATLWTTFNMGIGMILALPQESATQVMALPESAIYQPQILGSVTENETVQVIAKVCGLRSSGHHLVPL
ncbi:MAG: phosphoribosylformylglycinamidine cyclo-ligase [bacterium]